MAVQTPRNFASSAWVTAPQPEDLVCSQENAVADVAQEATSAALPPLPALPSTWKQEYEVHPDLPVIGAGSYGTVFQVRQKHTLQPFACKVIQRHFLDIRGMQSQIQAEIQLSQRASSSQYVVRFLGAAEEAGCIFMLQELCFFGTLEHELLAQKSGRIPNDRAICCARDLFRGLRDLHNLGIMHRDIKLENLLLTTGGRLKLTDFGWAATVEEKPEGIAGTFATMSPEVLSEGLQTTAVDLWSAGAVIFHIVVGHPLLRTNVGPGMTKLSQCFPHGATRARQERLLKEIYKNFSPFPASAPASATGLCWDLLGQLLQVDAARRPTSIEACRHQWIQLPEAQSAKHMMSFCDSSDRSCTNASETATPASSTRSSSLAPWSEASFA